MRPTERIACCLAALLVWFAPAALAEGPAPLIVIHAPPPPPAGAMPLVDRLDTWLDTHLGLARREAPPRVVQIAPAEAAAIIGPPERGFGPARGGYDRESGTIYLVSPWSAENPDDQAVLLHELVHHRQVGHHYACRGAEEEVAYRAQADWLAARGREADINWIAVVLAGGCTPRDIHPD